MNSDPFFTDLVNSFSESVNSESASIVVLDEESGDLVLMASSFEAEAKLIGAARYRFGEGLTGLVAESDKTISINTRQDLPSHPQWQGKYDNVLISSRQTHSILAIPIKGKSGKVIGVLRAVNKKSANFEFSDDDIQLALSFARTAAIALELQQKNYRLRKFIYAFILMPFAPSFDDIYRYGIKKPIEGLGITCERVDEIQYVGGVLEKVFECIEKARFVVADMTGRNPNVFYEVGYCHAIKKDVILCTQSAEDIPFDLRGYNHIVYEGSIKTLEEAIRKRVLSLIREEE